MHQLRAPRAEDDGVHVRRLAVLEGARLGAGGDRLQQGNLQARAKEQH